MPGGYQDFAIFLNFPSPRGAGYPLDGYPAIAEFRAMFAAVDPARNVPQQRWNGPRFFAYTGERDGELDFWFRGQGNGICLGLSAEDWAAVRELFRRAWDLPEVRDAWGVLTAEVEAH